MRRRMIDAILEAYQVAKPNIPEDMPGNYVPQLLCRFTLRDLRDLESMVKMSDEMLADKA